MDGVINVNKPSAMTSFDVVAILRKILNMKKIGHTGTLDPDATGVLPICIGKATKLVELLTANDKQYIATVKLGIVTDTQDISGNILKTSNVNTNKDDLINIIPSFIGAQEQIPPMYSAIKVNGKKLYELAREGKTAERKPRNITINNIVLDSYNNEENIFQITVDCSKGTYIRTLANDIGEKLGCGATLLSLKRIKSGRFSLDSSYNLDVIKEMAGNGDFSFITPIDEVMCEYKKIVLAEKNAFKLINGIKFDVSGLNLGEVYRIYDESKNFLAIGQKDTEKLLILKTFFG